MADGRFKILEKNSREIEVHLDGSLYLCQYTSECGRTYTRKEMKPNNHSCGYRRMSVGSVKNRGWHYAHRLVAEAFLPDYSERLQVDHIDGNKLNNSVSNLRMATSLNNLRAHRKTTGAVQYRGIQLSDNKKRYRARIASVNLGIYDTPEEAARAWDRKATELGYLPEALNFKN